MLLIVALIAGGFWYSDFALDAPPVDHRLLAGACLACGLSVQVRLMRSLSFFVAHSPLASDALDAGARARYLATWHLIAVAGLSVILWPVARSSSPLLLAAYPAGALSAAWWIDRLSPVLRRSRFRLARSSSRRRFGGHGGTSRLTATVAAHQSGSLGLRLHPVASWLLVAAIILAATIAAGRFADFPAARIVFAVGALAAAARLFRTDYALVAFLAFSGHGVRESLLPHIVAGGVFGAVLAAAAWLAIDPQLAVLAVIVTAGASAVTGFRILAYRLFPKRRADTLLALGALALAFLVPTAWFLLPVVIPVAAVLLGLKSRSATWLVR